MRVDEAVKGKKKWDLVLEDGDAVTIPREPIALDLERSISVVDQHRIRRRRLPLAD